MIDYTSHESLIGFEIEQLKEEGCEPTELADRYNRLQSHGADESEFEALWPLADSLSGTGPMEDAEPSDPSPSRTVTQPQPPDPPPARSWPNRPKTSATPSPEPGWVAAPDASSASRSRAGRIGPSGATWSLTTHFRPTTTSR